jgi:hypothetical protein
MEKLWDAVHTKYLHAHTIYVIGPLLQEGQAIMLNPQTLQHADQTDPLNTWVTLIMLGEFTGRHLFIPCLNLRLLYEPGAIIMLRGHCLPHKVEAWEGVQQVSIVPFTHKSLWHEFGMTCP